MSDPFAPNSQDQLLREAKRSLVIVALLIAVLAYVTFGRLTGHNRIPEHVRNAPIARTVWPYAKEAPDSASRHAARQAVREMSESRHEFANPAEFTEANSGDSESTNRIEQAEFQDDRRSPPDFAMEKCQDSIDRSKPPVISQSASRDFAPLSSNRSPAEEKEKPYPHTSAPLSATHSIASPISLIESKPEPDNNSAHPKKEIAVKTQSDSPLDPFESSGSNAKTAALDQVGNNGIARHAPAPNDFSPASPQFQPLPVPSPNSNPPQDFVANDSLVVSKPKLIAPNPIDRLADELQSIPSEFTRRTGDNSLGSREAMGQPADPGGKLVAATNQQPDEPKSARLHRVAEGESYYTIAQHYYGDGTYFRALSQFNQIKRTVAENLQVGTEIEIPKVEQLELDFPNEVPKQIGMIPTKSTFTSALSASSKTTNSESALNTNYVTKQGETLFEIAANELGQASRYMEIMEANRARLPHDICGSTPLRRELKLIIPTK